jgi:hypothetical protein
VKKFVEAVFFSKADLEKSVRMANKRDLYLTKINELLEVGAGSDIAGVRGTKYGLYNAATEFLTHHITDNDDRRLSQLWFGVNKQLNENALAYLLTA